MRAHMSSAYTIPFAKLDRHDVETVGGKNSSLGEMISHLAKAGVAVPDGFATTAQAYRDFLQHEGLAARISKELATLDVDDVEALTTVGARIRQWILGTPFPPRLEKEILESFERMSGGFFPSAREYTIGYGLTRDRLRTLGPDVPICHPGPMNRGLEIAADAADAAQSAVLEQVSAGVAIRMSILYHLLAGEEQS